MFYRYTVNDESSDDEEVGVLPSAHDLNASIKRSMSLQDKHTDSDEDEKDAYTNMAEITSNIVP